MHYYLIVFASVSRYQDTGSDAAITSNGAAALIDASAASSGLSCVIKEIQDIMILRFISLLCLCSCIAQDVLNNDLAPEDMHQPNSTLFFIVSHFKGNHSESRMDKQLMWFQNVTLQSVSNAAAFYGERMEGRPDVYYFLRLQGSYADRDLPKDEWASRFPHVKMVYLKTRKKWMDKQVSTVVDDFPNSILSITRLDADDSIALNFFYQLADLQTLVRFSKEVLLSGSSSLDMLDIGKTGDGSSYYCQYSLHSRPYLMSVGLTVTLSVDLWKKAMEGRLEFENHTRVRHLIMKLLEKVHLKNTVREVHLRQITGLYLKTELSSRHEKPPSNVTVVPCDRDLMALRIGHDNAHILWNAVQQSVPTLTPEELVQNVHLAHLMKMRESAAAVAAQKQLQNKNAADQTVQSPVGSPSQVRRSKN